ncbi:hypothetical protein [Tsuneonella mangrovi]|uniref:hypothetical protein n=1 Tax=Tsuneonella mangrovi TaxID=1982042 RepID=UPI000BA209B1|nr:hypothetical protein [Tsuneonella mangrovi]
MEPQLTLSRWTFAFPVAAAAALAGCSAPHSPAAPETPAAQTPPESGLSASEVAARNKQLLDAAEPFENLTESAPSTSSAELAALVDKAKAAAAGVASILDGKQGERLEAQLDAIDSAIKTDDRTGVALAAVEGYRTLVESAADTGRVPQAVSLLDYSGFRFQADLSASPPRWDDAQSALAFAEGKWALVEPKVTDAKLKADFTAALDTMGKAAQAKDVALARRASTRELDLVDGLEHYFSKMP